VRMVVPMSPAVPTSHVAGANILDRSIVNRNSDI
jgi:hypothetical protein